MEDPAAAPGRHSGGSAPRACGGKLRRGRALGRRLGRRMSAPGRRHRRDRPAPAIAHQGRRRWLPSAGSLIVNAIRPHRVEPRVKKRRPKSFPLMLKPRQTRRQQLVHQELGG